LPFGGGKLQNDRFVFFKRIGAEKIMKPLMRLFAPLTANYLPLV
jgi:hypothetical protein